ncbi:hypothetical protein BH23BAC3_BH23BAC3_31640 [soil metagenome]
MITLVSQSEFVFFIVKKSSATYQAIFKAASFLLLMAFLIPTGMQAKQLVDFCDMEMNSHHMSDAPLCHDCCESEKEESTDHHQNHDCDHGIICACNNAQTLPDENYIPTVRDTAVEPDVNVNFTLFFTTSEPIHKDLQKRIGQHDSPLYLLYDTFLM